MTRPNLFSLEEQEELSKIIDERLFHRVVAHHAKGLRKSRSTAALSSDPRNIVGFGFGEKETDERFSGQRSINVYVRKKIDPTKVSRRLRIPKKIAGIPTDVQETGEFVAAQTFPSLGTCLRDPRLRQPRPFPAGVSIGGGNNRAGTLGYFVRTLGSPDLLALSNFHVLGDLTNPANVLPIFQPGFGDAAPVQPNVVGRYTSGVPLRFDGTLNELDAAVAELVPGSVLPGICTVGRVTTIANPEVGDVVRFFGRSSRFSVGIVKEPVGRIGVDYRPLGTAFFMRQWRVVPMPPTRAFATSGDSGSLIVKGVATATALLIAANVRDGSALVTPLPLVLERLGVQLVMPSD